MPIRVLLLADTHLGFDFPFRPRIVRRRSGHDFFSNYELALQPAMMGEVDLVVHGGDLLYRNKVPPALVEMALEPLIRVAKAGIPVYLVPGNHERSRIPFQLWGQHPNLHIFDHPKTYYCRIGPITVGLSGFPFHRKIGTVFSELLSATKYTEAAADIRLLCIHAAVEGARVGPVGYTFRSGEDVVAGTQIPDGFAAVLAGHIHRKQILTHSMTKVPFAAPVIYPGSIERTSFAERFEEKHYVLMEFNAEKDPPLENVSFVPLPARPMVIVTFMGEGKSRTEMTREVEDTLRELDPDSVVRIQLQGPLGTGEASVFRAENLRRLAPASMNVSVRIPQAGQT